MSKKDFDEYFNKVCDDYSEMLQTLRDMEEEVNANIISPDKLDQLKQMIEPLKVNYMTLSWVAFLLNKPQRKRKGLPYIKAHKKYISTLDPTRSPAGILNENKTVIENVKSDEINSY